MPNLLAMLQGALPQTPSPPAKQLPRPLSAGDELNIPEPPPISIDDPEGRLSGRYSSTPLRQIIDMSRLEGVDPLTALAVAGQESGFGRYDAQNPLQLNTNVHGDPAEGHPVPDYALMQKAMQYLRERTARQRSITPDDEELIYQAYNGLGKIQGGSEVPPDTPMYGGQTELHGGRDRPYGKAILKLKKMLATQPSIQSLLDKR